MQKQNLDYIVANVDRFSGPFIDAVKKSIEVGIVVPSILRKNLDTAKFKIVSDDKDHAKLGFRKLENLYRVRVDGSLKYHPDNYGDKDLEQQYSKTDGILAMGCADSEDSALLHAVLGYVRECEVAEDRRAGKPPKQYGIVSRTAPPAKK